MMSELLFSLKIFIFGLGSSLALAQDDFIPIQTQKSPIFINLEGAKTVKVIFEGQIVPLVVGREVENKGNIVRIDLKGDASDPIFQDCLSMTINYTDKSSYIGTIYSGNKGCEGLPGTKAGNFILELAKTLARNEGVEKIDLSDASHIFCKDLNFQIRFSLIHASEKNVTWYEHHGFKPKNVDPLAYSLNTRQLMDYPFAKIIHSLEDYYQSQDQSELKKRMFIEIDKLFNYYQIKYDENLPSFKLRKKLKEEDNPNMTKILEIVSGIGALKNQLKYLTVIHASLEKLKKSVNPKMALETFRDFFTMFGREPEHCEFMAVFLGLLDSPFLGQYPIYSHMNYFLSNLPSHLEFANSSEENSCEESKPTFIDSFKEIILTPLSSPSP